MDVKEKVKKLQTLPWQALHDTAVKKGIDSKEVNGKDKTFIIEKLLLYSALTDQEIEQLVNDYIYGDRVAFTLWTFKAPLERNDFVDLYALEGVAEEYIHFSGYRKFKILSIKDIGNRIEILYVYSKEYAYIDESGHNAGVWEQHRGCLWIGQESTYLACISKHEKMTLFVTKYISEKVSNAITQMKPPKSAIDKCANFKAISRIVLQGRDGEKTVVSRAGGITLEQKDEIERIRGERIDTSGSFIAEITDDTDATVKYNVKNGSIGIYKYLPASVLFEWSENAINVILQEIDNLKGKPAEEIFREVGQEIKWRGASSVEASQLNWYLTKIIASLDDEKYQIQIPTEQSQILENDKYFMKLPRVYCKHCESYEIPHCSNCGKELKFCSNGIKNCDCGAPLRIKCSEGHDNCEIINWYLPKAALTNMINNNVQKVYKDYALEYYLCIIGDIMYIYNSEVRQTGVEIPFETIECFKHDPFEFSQRIQAYAVNLKEKCGMGCTRDNSKKCLRSKDMVCLPRLFFPILPGYHPQPHKGMEYGDIAAEVKVGNKSYELKGIIKKNSQNSKSGDDVKIRTYLLSSSKAGEEIIRQFVEQGMSDARCQIVAIIAPQYFDAGFKGTLRHLASLSGKKVTFIELDQICDLIFMNETISIS